MKPFQLRKNIALIILLGSWTNVVLATSSFNPSEHLVRERLYWNKAGVTIERSIESKVEATPPELLDYLKKLNKHQGFSEIPDNVAVSSEFKGSVKVALEEMPRIVKELVNRKLLGVFLVRNLGSTAVTDSVFDENDKPVAGFVVLDADRLNRNANEWATWKENSPFVSDGSNLKVAVEIETEKNNVRKNAIQYILLHEFGHIVSIADKNQLPWELRNGKYVSIFEKQFPKRSKIVFYGGPETKVPIQYSQQLYRSLKKTRFPTLYAATNPVDDFAESFASYVHTVLMHRPYRVTLHKGDQMIDSFTECWGEERCKEKRHLLEEYFH